MAIARRSPHINVMVEAAEKAGRGLVRDFGEVENLQVSKKGPGNFVSTADHKAERAIMGALQKARPRYGFLMEESGVTKGEDAENRWIVDPLDGTNNFLHGVPHWSISIALEKKGEVVAAVIYDPLRDEMFWAEKGLGAYCNNKRMTVSGRKNPQEAMTSIDVRSQPSVNGLADLMKAGMHVRCMGGSCLDLAYVAAGRLDVFFITEHRGGPWDWAAGGLLVKEARGIVTDMEGGKNYLAGKTILAANASLHTEFLKHLKSTTGKAKAS